MKIILHQKQVYFNANHSTITTDKRTLSTLVEYCEKLVNDDRLPNLHCGGSIESTISINADRKRYLSGIFLPTIPQSYGITTPEVYSELAVRATRRTKAGNRTNNADCLMAVVEPLPHPTQAVSFTNKLTRTIKMLFKFLLLGEGSLKFTTPHEFKLNHLPKTQSGISIESTTKHNGGYRSRNTSGIFLSQIHLSNGYAQKWADLSKAELVARATLRNKAGNRTNKEGYHPLWLVVEPLPRLLSVGKLSLNNITENFTMLFKFLLLGEKRLTVRIRAKSEAEARQRIQFTSPAICIARFSDNLTACSANSRQSREVFPENVGKSLYKTAQNLVQNDNLLITEQKTILTPLALIGYSAPVVAKSTAEPGNSNLLLQGEQHAKRAFFVRNFRTPKINQSAEKSADRIFSMVERNGKGSPFAVYLVGQFSSPLRSTAKTLESLAVVLNNLYKETVKMFYKFLFTGSRLRITVFANNLAEAYKRLPLSQTKLVLIARLPVQGGIYA